MAVIGVDQLLGAVVDPESFVSWNLADLSVPTREQNQARSSHCSLDTSSGLFDLYAGEIQAARTRTGHDESVVIGEATVGGYRLAVIVSDFEFLAGSVGRDACQRVIAAFDRAGSLSLPIFASSASGGTRMQEGAPAFALMADVAAAIGRYRARSGALVVWVRNPTTGGVMATWGSLGTMTFGEPGALVGFLGPRVFELLSDAPFPAGVQTTENLARVGVIDSVTTLAETRENLHRVLRVLSTRSLADGVVPDLPPAASFAEPAPEPSPMQEPDLRVDAWDAVLSTRNPQRPGLKEILSEASDVVVLSGTGAGERSDAVKVALCTLGGIGCVLVGQDRLAQAHGAGLDPAALRTARRGFRIASELGLALVTVIDTPGAQLSVAAEEAGLAGEIARCLVDIAELTVPTMSVLLGMGCGGGALALMPADRVISAQRAWLSPLPLEGASAIRYRTLIRAPEMARSQQVDAESLRTAGIVDVIVPECPDAAAEPGPFVARVVLAMATELASLVAIDAMDRRQRRLDRYRAGLQRGLGE